LEKADRCPVSNRKRDIEGSVESVAEEVASFGSDVTIIEPGGARIAKLMLIDTQIPAHSFLRMVGPKNGLAAGDPDQMAGRISQRVNVEPPPLRLVLGSLGLGGTLTTPLANTMPVRTTDRTRRFDGLSARSVTCRISQSLSVAQLLRKCFKTTYGAFLPNTTPVEQIIL
jgi:hypothetical protein